MNDWKEFLRQQMPLLGHRNWIVVTDKAYPLQTNPGVETLYAPEEFGDVISDVCTMIDGAYHVVPHVYQDLELKSIDEKLCPGIDAYRAKLDDALATLAQEPNYVLHEELIHKLDEVSKLFKVVIIKTNLVMPYTSVFFELDCGYWDAAREAELRSRMK